MSTCLCFAAEERAAPSIDCPYTVPVLHDNGVMANLTITVDDEILRRARIRALEQGTSVSAILAERLRAFAGESDAQLRATRALLALAKENSRRQGKARAKKTGRRRWTRDELHERR
jgi:uncharacterized protein YdaU (DUF1376 family)